MKPLVWVSTVEAVTMLLKLYSPRPVGTGWPMPGAVYDKPQSRCRADICVKPVTTRLYDRVNRDIERKCKCCL